jgi:hypothetical protein
MRAGLNPWLRLFHNMRSTCQTELEERFPSHVVCSWIGNTIQIAREHYLQITDDHFKKAQQNPTQHSAVLSGTASQTETAVTEPIIVTSGCCETLQKKTTECEFQSFDQIHPAGFEPTTYGLGNREDAANQTAV